MLFCEWTGEIHCLNVSFFGTGSRQCPRDMVWTDCGSACPEKCDNPPAQMCTMVKNERLIQEWTRKLLVFNLLCLMKFVSVFLAMCPRLRLFARIGFKQCWKLCNERSVLNVKIAWHFAKLKNVRLKNKSPNFLFANVIQRFPSVSF